MMPAMSIRQGTQLRSGNQVQLMHAAQLDGLLAHGAAVCPIPALASRCLYETCFAASS